MKTLFNRKYKFKTLMIFGFIMFLCGLTIFVSASSYNSEEIGYDNSTSHASATNVKDALDYLYSHGSCGEGMSCLESPIVTISWNEHGSVNKSSMIVPISGSNKIKVTPISTYLLRNIACTNGYQISSYRTNGEEQEIEITNPGIVQGSACTVQFEAPVELSVSSTQLHGTYKTDNCNSNGSGCICYQIKNNITNFTYESHTGCNFKSKTCKYSYGSKNGQTFDCEFLYWRDTNYWFDRTDSTSSAGYAACSGVITCET